MATPPKLLVLAGETDGDLGDLAIVTATCQILRKITPDCRISQVTSRPGHDHNDLGISPIRRGWCGIVALFYAARRADIAICGGGGLFQDDDSLAKIRDWAKRLILLWLVHDNVVLQLRCDRRAQCRAYRKPSSRSTAKISIGHFSFR
jgi:hypothetical protein